MPGLDFMPGTSMLREEYERLVAGGYESQCGTPGCCMRDAEGCSPDGDRDPSWEDDDYDSDGPDTSGLLNYSYRPAFKFYGTRAPYYGLEIEVTTDEISNAVEIVNEYNPYDAPGLIYCKEDGSVAGLEMVTHPMSYEWAMAKFPWDLLPALRQRADATTVPQENGIHIHVGRDGFDGPEHLYRWMKLWYRNPNDMQRLARRRSDEWASFQPEARQGQLTHVKTFGKPGYDTYEDPTARRRYNAINTQNADTLEVRVFASTLRPRRAQAALQLVAGTVEYARELTAEQVCHRHGWEWAAFMSYAKDHGYDALVAEDRVRRSA